MATPIGENLHFSHNAQLGWHQYKITMECFKNAVQTHNCQRKTYLYLCGTLSYWLCLFQHQSSLHYKLKPAIFKVLTRQPNVSPSACT
jgi:hypothetical protein